MNHPRLYPESRSYAATTGELDAYHQSQQLNTECADTIDKAISGCALEENRYDLRKACRQVVAAYGYERPLWVLAQTVQQLIGDGRLSEDTHAWARDFTIPQEGRCFVTTHPILLESFISQLRTQHLAVVADAVGVYEQDRRFSERNRLTWFYNDMGSYVAHSWVSEQQLMERYHDAELSQLVKQAKRDAAREQESVGGYRITHLICFSNGYGFALGKNPEAVEPFATWFFREQEGQRDFSWGHYFASSSGARSDFQTRIDSYRRELPSLTVRSARSDAIENEKASVQERITEARQDRDAAQKVEASPQKVKGVMER